MSARSTSLLVMIIAAVGEAVVWNMITRYPGLASSSFHALIDGLLGAGAVVLGIGGVNLSRVVKAVMAPMLFPPVIGLAAGYVFFAIIRSLFSRAHRIAGHLFRVLKKPSMVLLSASHGSSRRRSPWES